MPSPQGLNPLSRSSIIINVIFIEIRVTTIYVFSEFFKYFLLCFFFFLVSFVLDLIIVDLILIFDCLSFKLFSGILTGISKCNKNCKKFDNFTKDTTYKK